MAEGGRGGGFNDRQVIDVKNPEYHVEAKIITDIQGDVAYVADLIQKSEFNTSCDANIDSGGLNLSESCNYPPVLKDTVALSSLKNDLIDLTKLVKSDKLTHIVKDVDNVIAALMGTKSQNQFSDFPGMDFGVRKKRYAQNPRRPREAGTSEQQELEKLRREHLINTYIEIALEHLGCYMDYMWAHLAKLKFTIQDCTYCGDKRKSGICYCPLLKQGKPALQKINCDLLCQSPGRCISLRQLFGIKIPKR